MPIREMLEKSPLYGKHPFDPKWVYLNRVPKVPITMLCKYCESDQTYNMTNEFSEAMAPVDSPAGCTCRLEYKCMSCDTHIRVFVVRFSDDRTSVEKIGQYPPWSIETDKTVDKMLGEHVDLFKKGVICESQGYGIGAFGYYRRIVELVIGELLNNISDLLSGPERDFYITVLEKVKSTPVAEDKIALVKDLLPPTLRPDGMNPLSVLHSTLSEGLHEAADEVCLELAAAVRESLIFLVDQVAAAQTRRNSFTDSMRKLLDRKARKNA